MEYKHTNIIKTSSEGPYSEHVWKYNLVLPPALHEWDVWDYWEKERLQSMQENLNSKDTLFDIGSEQGAMSALFSKYMTESIVLFEPTKEFWPGIKAIFEQNNLAQPVGFFNGFAASSTDDKTKRIFPYKSWPKESKGEVIERREYNNLFEPKHFGSIRRITIDDYVKRTKIKPTALTIDVEGGELEVLKGAKNTLKSEKPLVWISIHPDLLERDYGVKAEEVVEFMVKLDFHFRLLAVDHEEHWIFWHREGRQLL